jgi:hypothetical protein
MSLTLSSSKVDVDSLSLSLSLSGHLSVMDWRSLCNGYQTGIPNYSIFPLNFTYIPGHLPMDNQQLRHGFVLVRKLKADLYVVRFRFSVVRSLSFQKYAWINCNILLKKPYFNPLGAVVAEMRRD